MAHEVHQHDTVTCADGQSTWHKINTLVVETMKTLQDTRLDWKVKQFPLMFQGENGPQIVPENFVNIREDLNLPVGVVGKDYRIIQNEQVFNAVQRIFDGKAELITAGSLFNCRRIWFLAKLTEGQRKVCGDKFENYLLASSSHDGTLKLDLRLSQTRVVCNNTLTCALHSGSQVVSVPHTDCAEFRIGQVGLFYDEVFQGIDKTAATLESLASKQCDIQTAYDFASGFLVAKTTKSQNIARQIVAKFARGLGNVGKSRYDLLNGFTERFTHGADDEGDNGEKSPIARFVSSTFGNDAGRKVQALASIADDEKFAGLVERGGKFNSDYLASESSKKSTALFQFEGLANAAN